MAGDVLVSCRQYRTRSLQLLLEATAYGFRCGLVVDTEPSSCRYCLGPYVCTRRSHAVWSLSRRPAVPSGIVDAPAASTTGAGLFFNVAALGPAKYSSGRTDRSLKTSLADPSTDEVRSELIYLLSFGI